MFAMLALMPACGGGMPQPPPPPPPPKFTLVKLSSDTLTNSDGQHATELETSAFSFGSTIVISFEVARGNGHGGGADMGFVTSTDAGATWTSAYLSGLTTVQGGAGFATGNATVTYDAAHQVWLIETVVVFPQHSGSEIVVVQSPDGINWDPNPNVVSNNTSPDKPWITCDNAPASPFYGHCYIQWEDGGNGTLYFSTSADGGVTWSHAASPVGTMVGSNGQLVVQPDGTVVVPLITTTPANYFGGPADISSIISTDGGVSWNAPVPISPNVQFHPTFDFRTGPAPSVGIDSAGKVYAVWEDCSFRSGCSSNDLILSTSLDGINWSTPARIPIDLVTSTIDHFTPGLAVDSNTAGSTAHLLLTYYSYAQANCTDATCQLNLGFVTSQDGGNTWSTAQTLAGPMSLNWIPETSLGRDVGDYTSSCFVNGKGFGFFPIAHANMGTTLDQAIYTTATPLAQ
jgi:hypothetical protein